MPHGEVLLCLGQSDYAAIEPFRRESFFARALGLSRLPSEETLRQRLDQLGTAPLVILHEETAALLRANAPVLAPCHRGRVPLLFQGETSPSSGTKKEDDERDSWSLTHGSIRTDRFATLSATAARLWASAGLRLRFGQHPKSLFDKHKPFIHKHLQATWTD